MTRKKATITLTIILLILAAFPKAGIEQGSGTPPIFGVFQNTTATASFVSNESLSTVIPFAYANGTQFNASVATWNITYTYDGRNGTQDYTWYYDASGFMAGYSFLTRLGNLTSYTVVKTDFILRNGTALLFNEGWTNRSDESYFSYGNTSYAFSNTVYLNGSMASGSLVAYHSNITQYLVERYANYTVYTTMRNSTIMQVTQYANGTIINDTRYVPLNQIYRIDWAWSISLRKIVLFDFRIVFGGLGLESTATLYRKELVESPTTPEPTSDTSQGYTSETGTSNESVSSGTSSPSATSQGTSGTTGVTTPEPSEETGRMTGTSRIEPAYVGAIMLFLPVAMVLMARRNDMHKT